MTDAVTTDPKAIQAQHSWEAEVPRDLPGQTWVRLASCIIGPLAVAFLALFVFRVTNDSFDIGLNLASGTGPVWTLDPKAAGYWSLIADERKARLLWQTTIVGLMVASVAAIVISLWIMTAALAGRARGILLSSLGAMVAVMVPFIWTNDASLEYLRDAILEPTVGQALALTKSSFTLDIFQLSRKLTNGFSTAATIAIVFAIAAATQMQTGPTNGMDFERRARRLARQAQRLHILLYAGAAVLITIVLSMSAWLLWPVSLAGSPEIKARLLDIASGIGMFWGTSFTLILAAAYLPSAMWLNRHIRALYPEAEEQQSPASAGDVRQKTMARFDLTQSVFSQVTQLVAVLSPMITGAVPFLDKLT